MIFKLLTYSIKINSGPGVLAKQRAPAVIPGPLPSQPSTQSLLPRLGAFPSHNYSIMLLEFRMCSTPEPCRHCPSFALSSLIPVAPSLGEHSGGPAGQPTPKASGLSTSHGHSDVGGGWQATQRIKYQANQIKWQPGPPGKGRLGVERAGAGACPPPSTQGAAPCYIRCPPLKPH